MILPRRRPLLGPVYRYSDTWQLVINTATTIMTFLMVFLIQNTQNRDAKAVQLKLEAGLAIGLVLLLTSAAQAISMSFTASGVGGDGAESAAATVTTGVGTVTVALSSLITNPKAAGQLASGIQINLGGGVPATASLSSQTGPLINIAPGGAVTPVAGNPTYWGATVSGGTIFLVTAGTRAPGGSPINLIIGTAATYPAANPSIAGRNPQIQGTGNFILTTAGVLATTPITSVVFEFGTGPDSTLPGVPVPERFSLPEWCLLLALRWFMFAGTGRARLDACIRRNVQRT